MMKQEYQSHPHLETDDAQYRCALSLWSWYYVTTEDFDRTVCHVVQDGVAVPCSPYERTLCSRFAAVQMKTLQRVSKRLAIDAMRLQRARVVAFDLGYERQKYWLSEHGVPRSWFIDID